VNLPAGLSPDQTPVLNGALARSLLDEYNKQNDAPRFRVYESTFGLHFIPETMRDAGGNVVPADNPLSAVVDVPVASRTFTDHLEALCATVRKAAGRRVSCGWVSLNNESDWGESLFAAPGGDLPSVLPHSPGPWIFAKGGRFEWGSAGMSARDALIVLFARSATTFSWQFRCASPWSADRACVLTVDRVRVAKPDGRGNTTIETLQYDRCPQCAPLRQAPSAR
jgi:hypothetical protein